MYNRKRPFTFINRKSDYGGGGAREGRCPLCGRNEVLYPAYSTVIMCPNCLSKIYALDELKARGLITKFPNVSRNVRCDICGAWSPVMFAVKFPYLCFHCMWYTLGKQKRRMSIWGDRIV